MLVAIFLASLPVLGPICFMAAFMYSAALETTPFGPFRKTLRSIAQRWDRIVADDRYEFRPLEMKFPLLPARSRGEGGQLSLFESGDGSVSFPSDDNGWLSDV